MIVATKEDRMAPTMTIGIDLGDRKSHVCVLDSDGQVFWRGEFPSTRDGAETSCAASLPHAW